jgi:hypothetical protein
MGCPTLEINPKGKNGSRWDVEGRYREQGKIIARKTRTYVNGHQRKGMKIQNMEVERTGRDGNDFTTP